MEKEAELIYSEMKNPIFQALENQLRLEFEWAYADKNLYSISWITLYLKDLKSEDLRKIKTLDPMQQWCRMDLDPGNLSRYFLQLDSSSLIRSEKSKRDKSRVPGYHKVVCML
jgi:hypothetical protein